MSIVNLYDGIYKVLSNDTTVLNYLGLEIGSSLTEKAKHIQKRSKPQRLADTVPILTFWAQPGQPSMGNHLVYEVPIIFEVYTEDRVDTAQQLIDRVMQLFIGKAVGMDGVTSMETNFITVHESSVDVENIYCFTLALEFFISIEEYYKRSDR